MQVEVSYMELIEFNHSVCGKIFQHDWAILYSSVTPNQALNNIPCCGFGSTRVVLWWAATNHSMTLKDPME